MRVLLATEGESDEVVAQALIHRSCPEAAVVPKRFPARGFPVVARLLSDTVRAAYFGHFDVLVIHFDLDDTLPSLFQNVGESPRWQEIQLAIATTLAPLHSIGRTAPLRSILMAPCQSTDAWVTWGRENQEGRQWEIQSRHELKRKMYGTPPRDLVRKAKEYTEGLLHQMASSTIWPQSLRDFIDSLETALKPPGTGNGVS